MNNYKLIQLLECDGTWHEFERDWRTQCEKYDEDFEEYTSSTYSVVREIIEKEHHSAGVYALYGKETYRSMCQLNVASLPGYDSPVLRARYLTLCPELDFGDNPLDYYLEALIHTFSGIMALSNNFLESNLKHVKFHLRSPADRQFFYALSGGLKELEEFESVEAKGAWLYVTKS